MDKDLEKKLGNKMELFNKLHQFIMSLNPKIEHRLSTVYVRYMLNDKVIAVVYFRGKFVLDCPINVGFAFKKKPVNSNFVNAKYMNYPNISYSIKLTNDKDITRNLSDQLRKILS